MYISYHKNGQKFETTISNATFIKAWTEKQTASLHIYKNDVAVIKMIILAIIVSILMVICYLVYLVKCHKQNYKNSHFECDHSFEIPKMACQNGARDFGYRRLTILPGGTSFFVKNNEVFSDSGIQKQKRFSIDRSRLATI